MSIRKISIILIPVCLMTVWIGLGSVFDRFSQLPVSVKGASDEGRMQVWEDSRSLIKDFPALGTGLGTFEFSFPKYKTFKEGYYMIMPTMTM